MIFGGILALIMGSLMALFPRQSEQAVRSAREAAIGKKLSDRTMLTRTVRVGGILIIIFGIVVIVLAVMGVFEAH